MLSIRERAPLRLHYIAESPTGRVHRWAEDEPDPSNAPSGVRFGDAMPGGYDSFSAILPREPGRDYSDLDLFSTIYVRGVGGEPVGEYMLERTPRVSGDQMAITPEAPGWQAHLEHDRSAGTVYVDRDLSAWEGMSAQRRADTLADFTLFDPQTNPDLATGNPQLLTEVTGAWPNGALSEALYLASNGALLKEVYVDWVSYVVSTFTAFGQTIHGVDNDLTTPSEQWSVDLQTTGSSGAGYFSGTAARRGVLLQFQHPGAGSTDGRQHGIRWRKVAVYGDHGLTKRGSADPKGFWASDVIAHAVRTWAPLLRFTEGADGTITPTDFVLDQISFREDTTVAEIVKQANRVHLRPWAVWDDRTFHYSDRPGREWLGRVGPAKLRETGQDADRAWESIVVEYRDVDGSTRTVGPPGSGADVEDAVLKDSDPANAANNLGAPKRDKLVMDTSTAAVATEVGRRFLEASKELDRSGAAEFTGYVEDSNGIERPYHEMKAGDTVRFVDASDPSPRRIVKTDKSPREASCPVDLDAPPDGLSALLERLGAVIAPLGF